MLIGSVTASDVDGDALTYSLVANASNGSVVVNANGTFIYTPNAELQRSGHVHVQGQRRHRGLEHGHGVDHGHAGQRCAGGEQRQSITTNEDTAVSGTLGGTDVDNATLTYAVLSGPAHGTLTVFNRRRAHSPTRRHLNYNGPDSVHLQGQRRNRGLATRPRSASRSTPVNDAPVANNGSADDDRGHGFDRQCDGFGRGRRRADLQSGGEREPWLGGGQRQRHVRVHAEA